ncbi:MAG: excisionase family DNA-binding protein [Burkholderiales bacterium]
MNSAAMRTEAEMISAKEAAEISNVSLPHLAELTESGELKAVKVGDSVCLSRAEVRAYKDASTKQRKTALDELAKLSQELGLG